MIFALLAVLLDLYTEEYGTNEYGARATIASRLCLGYDKLKS